MLKSLLDHIRRHDMMYCTCQMYLILPRIQWVAEEEAHSRTLKILLVLQKESIFFSQKLGFFFSSYLTVFTLQNNKATTGQGKF